MSTIVDEERSTNFTAYIQEELPKVKLAWVAKWIGVPLVFVGIGLAVYYLRKQA